jgi:hypothetical protein
VLALISAQKRSVLGLVIRAPWRAAIQAMQA